MEIGDTAPDFELPDQQGKTGAPEPVSGKKPRGGLFLSEGRYQRLHDRGLRVPRRFRKVPRSRSGSDRHQRRLDGIAWEICLEVQTAFHAAERQRRSVRKLYGVKKTLGVIPGRVTFVIDREGVDPAQVFVAIETDAACRGSIDRAGVAALAFQVAKRVFDFAPRVL